MSKLETNTIDTVSGTTNLVIGSTNSSTVTFENGSPTGHMYPAFEAKRSGAQTLSHDTETKVAVDVEVFDTNSCYDNSTNYRFTPTVAGKYYIYAQAVGEAGIAQLKRYSLIIKRNGSNYKYMSQYFTNNEGYINNIFIGAVIDFNGSSDYVELFTKIEYASSGTVKIDGGTAGPTFGGYRIGA